MPEDVRPLFFSPDVQSERATNVTLDQILHKQEHMTRKTKIICTAGPGCWSEEMLSKVGTWVSMRMVKVPPVTRRTVSDACYAHALLLTQAMTKIVVGHYDENISFGWCFCCLNCPSACSIP